MPVSRTLLWPAAKALFAAAIVAGVGVLFYRTLTAPELAGRDLWAVNPAWLSVSALLYLSAHTLWATFFWQLLRGMNVNCGWRAAARAYFVSQFGKYVPGKVWVIVMRVGLLSDTSASRAVIVAAGFYEAITNMAAGAMVAAVMLPVAGIAGEYTAGRGLLFAGLAALPVGVWAFVKLAGRLARTRRGPDARPLPSPPPGLLARGLLQAAAGWCLLGLSLWAGVNAVVPEALPLDGGEFAFDLAAIAAAYVVGFVVLVSPGGLGPREFLLNAFLVPHLGETRPPPDAAAAAVLTALFARLAWTAGEVVVAGTWYLLGRPKRGAA